MESFLNKVQEKFSHIDFDSKTQEEIEKIVESMSKSEFEDPQYVVMKSLWVQKFSELTSKVEIDIKDIEFNECKEFISFIIVIKIKPENIDFKALSMIILNKKCGLCAPYMRPLSGRTAYIKERNVPMTGMMQLTGNDSMWARNNHIEKSVAIIEPPSLIIREKGIIINLPYSTIRKKLKEIIEEYGKLFNKDVSMFIKQVENENFQYEE